MLDTTIDKIKAALKADPSLSGKTRSDLLMLIRQGDVGPRQPKATERRLKRRLEAARLLAVSPRSVDRWAKAGLLDKVRLPAHHRASGFVLSDVEALISTTPFEVSPIHEAPTTAKDRGRANTKCNTQTSEP